jgi:hypothetical protein
MSGGGGTPGGGHGSRVHHVGVGTVRAAWWTGDAPELAFTVAVPPTRVTFPPDSDTARRAVDDEAEVAREVAGDVLRDLAARVDPRCRPAADPVACAAALMISSRVLHARLRDGASVADVAEQVKAIGVLAAKLGG